MMEKYEAPADVYKAKYYEIQQVELLGVDAEGVQSMLDSIDTSAPLLKSKLQILSDKITAVEASIISLNKNIRTVLTSYCNIPERVRQEQTISTTTIKLPDKLANGKPDPLVAEELVTVMIRLMCTYPDQLWAIIPALTRLVNDDVSDASNTEPWIPPLLESNYAEIPQQLFTFYVQHNKRLYDTLLNINRQAVQRALSTFSTGDDSALRMSRPCITRPLRLWKTSLQLLTTLLAILAQVMHVDGIQPHCNGTQTTATLAIEMTVTSAAL